MQIMAIIGGGCYSVRFVATAPVMLISRQCLEANKLLELGQIGATSARPMILGLFVYMKSMLP